MTTSAPDTISGGRLAKMVDGRYSPEAVMVLTTSIIALYNSIELLILIFLRFRVRSGLYFWSITLASFSLIPYCIGWMIDNFYLAPEWLGMALGSVGWMFLISGHSMVLYSRLHLVLQNTKTLRAVLGMIIVNAVIWYPSVWIVYFGAHFAPLSSRSQFVTAFNIIEKVQMTCFCIQEFIISGLYIWNILDILNTSFGSKRAFIWRLCAINLFIIIIDIALLAIEYRGLFLWEQGVKAATYSIKLKLEFAVLGQLVEFVQHGSASRSNPSNPNAGVFVEISDGNNTGDARRRSTLRKEKSRMDEATSIRIENATATTSNPGLLQPHGSDHTKVRTRSEIGSSSAEPGYESSGSHLYEVALQDILTPGSTTR